ncbi:MAG: hypothetical protein IH983_02060 [Planctomycetes bacterium]|nr:hypothetical protein [Planctomycetota bacterium]
MPELEQQEISDDEIILRRIPNQPDCIKHRPGIGLTATSFAIRNLPGKKGSSWTRLVQTSPRKLLDQLQLDGISPKGWMVCRIRVSDVRDFRLDVIHLPTERDAGHCEIRETPRQSFSPAIWSKLARRTRILTAEEVETLQAGNQLAE